MHCKQIQQWLDQEKIVLCDRYTESTYAYQGAQLENYIKNPIKWLKDLSKNHIIVPDRTFLFVIDTKIALSRIKHREILIPFEHLSFLERVHNNYLQLSTETRFLKIDATKKKKELVDICYNDILS